MKLSIVIPCYNEEKNIPLLLERFAEIVGNRDMEIILVNNGSTDNSAKVMERLLPKYKFAKIVTVPVNKGYGYGILKGLEEAKGEFVGWTHADMQTDPNDIIKAWRIIEKSESKDIYVKGRRKGRTLYEQFFTVGMGIFESGYLGVPMYDINAQPNIFPRKFLLKWQEPPYDFSLELYCLYLVRKYNMKVIRFVVEFHERRNGHSSWNKGLRSRLNLIRQTILYSRKLKHSIRQKN